jgi:hypothetical protein
MNINQIANQLIQPLKELTRVIIENQLNQLIITSKNRNLDERENYHAGRGYAKGVADVRARERAIQQEERNQNQAMRNIEKMFEVPKMNDNFLFDSDSPKKKKRTIFDD